MYNNDRFFRIRKLLSKDDERPPSEAGPQPPKTQNPQKQASLRMFLTLTPKEETVTQVQEDEVPLALTKRKRDADEQCYATPPSEVPNNSLLNQFQQLVHPISFDPLRDPTQCALGALLPRVARADSAHTRHM
jgi:hypothetical protein